MSPQEFLEEITALWEKKRGIWKKENPAGEEKQREDKQKEAIPCIPPELLRIYEALDFYPQALEQIAEKLSDIYNPVQVNTLLLQLVMQGWAEQLSPGYFCRSRRFYE